MKFSIFFALIMCSFVLALISIFSNALLAPKSGTPLVIANLTSDTYFNGLSDGVSTLLQPFRFNFRSPVSGKIIVFASCYASGDQGHPTTWILSLVDSPYSGYEETIHDVQAQTHVDNVLLIPMSLQASFDYSRYDRHVISLYASQSGSIGDEGLVNLAWTVTFVKN